MLSRISLHYITVINIGQFMYKTDKPQIKRFVLCLHYIQSGPKSENMSVLPLTLSNLNRFAAIFHCVENENISNATGITYM